jgi:hypothetical protein
MIAQRIANYLDTLSDWTVGTNVFLGAIPIEFEIGVVLQDFGGISNETGMGKFGLQILSIHNDYVSAELACSSIFDTLIFSNGFTVDTDYVYNCIPLSSPKYININQVGKVVFTASVVVITKRN